MPRPPCQWSSLPYGLLHQLQGFLMFEHVGLIITLAVELGGVDGIFAQLLLDDIFRLW